MSNLLGPNGMPVAPSTRQLTDQQIVMALTQLENMTKGMMQTIIQLGLHHEFIYDRIASATDADGNPLVEIDMTEFPAFAEERYAQMQEEQQRLMKEQQTPEGVDFGD